MIKNRMLKLSLRFGLLVLNIIMLLGSDYANGQVKTEVYALMGQSNMAGRGKIDSIANSFVSNRLFMLTKDDSIVLAKNPVHFDKPKIDGVGPGLKFGYELSKNTKDNILLVPCAVGGTAISLWQPGMRDSVTNSFPYDDALRRIKVAMQSGKLCGVIWHQGEADRNNPKYIDQLVELIQRVRAFAGNDKLPFVVGELGHFLANTETFNKNLWELPKRLKNVAVVSTEGLTDRGDKLHFSSRSAEILGKRYAKAMESLRNSNQKVFNERIEWTDTWVVEANKHDLPRVLVIGDSHVNAYYPVVADLLKNKAYTSKFTSSKCAGDPVYIEQLKWFLKSYKFDIISFNNGLHGSDVPLDQYTKGLKDVYQLFKEYQPDAKLVWVNTTSRRIANNTIELDSLNQQVINRNKALTNFAKEHKIPVVDSYTLSINHPEFYRTDGIHFIQAGVNEEAKGVESQIIQVINQTK